MSQPRLALGTTDFEEMREKGRFFVDKTLLIEQILEMGSKVMLFLRPRRFGKTLNLWMVRTFFERDGKNREHLFKGLQIEKSPFFSQCGTKPVIFLSFKDIKKPTWVEARKLLALVLQREARRLRAIAQTFSSDNAARFDEFLENETSDIYLESYLERLTSVLYEIHVSKVIVLIDEYDTPFQYAEKMGYSADVIDFFRIFFPMALKDNPALELGILTGILRVAKESIFSGLNHLDVFDPIRKDMAGFFGFNEEEVTNALKEFGLMAKENEVKDWYNGYQFGEEKIYNPWSILKYLSEKHMGSFWVETATAEEVGRILESSLAHQHGFLNKLMALAQVFPK